MIDQIIEFEKLPDNNFFNLDGIRYCKFGRYGLGFHNGEKAFKIVEPKTLIKCIELKDVFNLKKVN